MTIKQLLITSFLLVSVIFATASVAKAESKNYDTNIVLKTGDANLLTINDRKTEIVAGISNEDMNALNQNPTPEMIQSFMRSIAPEYSIDWKMVYAIGYHESGNYGSALARSNNNYFGRKANSSSYASWSTPEEGIRNQFEYLKTRYIDKGMNTPAEINPVYAEDSGWHYKVESVMASL